MGNQNTDEKDKECKYPDCFYYKEDAREYCCGGCAFDHHDYIRLELDKE